MKAERLTLSLTIVLLQGSVLCTSFKSSHSAGNMGSVARRTGLGDWLGLKQNTLVGYAALLLCLETLMHRNR